MTSHRLPASGEVLPLVRRLAGAPDPLALYGALSRSGTVAHTQLLESADQADGQGGRSLIAVRAALHIEADREGVQVQALSANGRAAIAWLAEREGSFLAGNRLTVPLPLRAEPWPDEATRFRQPSPLDLVRRLQQGPRLVSRPSPWCHLLLGILGYDLVDCFEALPAGGADPLEQPALEMWLPDQLIVIDHRRHQTTVITTVWGGDEAPLRYHDAARDLERLVGVVALAPASVPVRPGAEPDPGLDLGDVPVDLDDGTFANLVRRLQEHLRAGDVYQVVPSRSFSLPCPDPFAGYQALRARNPSPYLFYLQGERGTLFGASPETCVRVDGASRRLSLLPIAGTAPRGRTLDGRFDPEADTRNEVALRLDAKEAAEHLMLVDLARNDVARVAEPGTRAVTRLLEVERYQHVMHLVSEVSGTLRPGVDALEAYAATLNMGTLVGAPKIRAAALLRELEPSRRGWYGGAVGYLRDDDTMETAIVIRSAVVRDGTAFVRAGAGVVLDSDPWQEAMETRRKAQAVLEAVVLAGGAVHV